MKKLILVVFAIVSLVTVGIKAEQLIVDGDVTLDGTTSINFDGNTVGIVVVNDGTITVSTTTSKENPITANLNTEYGIKVDGTSLKITAPQEELVSSIFMEIKNNGKNGIDVNNGKIEFTVQQLNISSNTVGVNLIKSSANISNLEDIEFFGNSEYGMNLENSEIDMSVSKMVIDGGTIGAGIKAIGSQLDIKVDELTIKNSKSAGIELLNESSLTLSRYYNDLTKQIVNNKEAGIYIDSTSSLNISEVTISISSNNKGIDAQVGSTANIIGSNIELIDNKLIALNNVNLASSTIVIGQTTGKLGNWEDKVNGLTGFGNELTIEGFNDGINLGSNLVKTVFNGSRLTANNNGYGFKIYGEEEIEVEGKVIKGSSNTVGFIINNTTATITSVINIADSEEEGLKIEGSSVTTSYANIKLSGNKGIGIKIADSKYYDEIGIIEIDAKGVGKGVEIETSTVTLETTDLIIENSIGNALTLRNSSMTIGSQAQTGSLIITGSQANGIYVDSNSYLLIKDIMTSGTKAIEIIGGENGIYGEEGAQIELIHNVIKFEDNAGLALRNVKITSNTITIAQSSTSVGYRVKDFIEKTEKISGVGNSLEIRGFKNGIDFSEEMYNTGIFNGSYLRADDNEYGFKIEGIEYILEDKMIKGSSNTVGFIINNSSATINVELDIDSSWQEGIEIKESSVAINGALNLVNNKGYGIEISSSIVNLVGSVDIQGQGGKGIKIYGSEIGLFNNIKITSVTGVGIEVEGSNINGLGTTIEISSASGNGIDIKGNSNMVVGVSTTTEYEIDSRIEVKGSKYGIYVDGTSSLIVTSGTIVVEDSQKGIYGQEASTIELTGIDLKFKNIEEEILNRVKIVSTTLRLEEVGREKDFSDKVKEVIGYGNELEIKGFNEGIELTEASQSLFSGGRIRVEDNNKGIIVKQDISIGGNIKGSSNTIAMLIEGSEVNINGNIELEKNETGIVISSSVVDIVDGTIVSRESKVGLDISCSTVTIANADIRINSNSEAGIRAEQSSVTIKASGLLMSITGAGTGETLISSNSYVGIDLGEAQLNISSSTRGIVVDQGEMEIKGTGIYSISEIKDNEEEGIYVKGEGSKIKVGTDRLNLTNNGKGIVVEQGELIGGEIYIEGKGAKTGVGLELRGETSEISKGSIFIEGVKEGIVISSGASFGINEDEEITIRNVGGGIVSRGEGSNLTIKGVNELYFYGTRDVLVAEEGGQMDIKVGLNLNGKGTETILHSKGKSIEGNSSKIIIDRIRANNNEGTAIGLLAEDGGLIEVKSSIETSYNKESGIEIRGEGSGITFNSLTSNNNGYGIKVSSGANYEINNEQTNMTLGNNSIAAIGIINSSMTITKVGIINTNGNEVGVKLEENSYLEVKEGTFSVNKNNTNGIEIIGNSETNIDGKLEANENKANGIVIEAGSSLLAKEIEANRNNVSGIEIKDSTDTNIGFDKLTANDNGYGIEVIKSSWAIEGQRMEFRGNDVALDIKGSTINIASVENIETENNRIFMDIGNYYEYEIEEETGEIISVSTYTSKVKSEVDIEVEGNKEAGIRVIGEGSVGEFENIESRNNGDEINEADGIVIGYGGKLVAKEIKVKNNSNAGVKVIGEGSKIEFDKLEAVNNKYGIEIEGVTGEIGIKGESKIELNTVAGIYVSNGSSASITDSIKVDNNGVGIKVEGGSYIGIEKDINISSNTIAAIEIERGELEAKGDINLKRNEIGIRVVDKGKVEIAGDMEIEGSETGIITDNSSIEIGGNIKITDSKLGIEAINGSEINVKDVEIVSTDSESAKGIIISRGSKIEIGGKGKIEGTSLALGVSSGEVTITDGNLVIKDNGIGMEVSRGEVTITKGNLEIKDNERGIIVEQSLIDIANGSIVSDNNGEYGIEIKGSTITSSGKIEATNNEIGIKVEDSKVATNQLKISSNNCGIEVGRAEEVEIGIEGEGTKVEIKGNKKGIEVVGGSLKIVGDIDSMESEGNDIVAEVTNGGILEVGKGFKAERSKNDGIKVTGRSEERVSELIGEGIEASNNENDGIVVENKGKVRVKELIVKGNGRYGINVYDGKVEVDSIEVTGNEYGIYNRDGQVKISSNAIIKGNETGIYANSKGEIDLGESIVDVSSNGIGIKVTGENNIKAIGSQISISSNIIGMQMEAGSKIELKRAEIEANGVGIDVIGEGTGISGQEIEIKGNKVGIRAQNGASMVIDEQIGKLSLEANEVAIKAEGQASKIEIKSLNSVGTIDNEVFIEATDKGTVGLAKGIEIKGNKEGIKVRKEGVIEGEQVKVSSNVVGVNVENNGIVKISELNIENNVTGLKLNNGKLEVSKIIAKNNGIGIELEGGENRLEAVSEIEANDIGIEITNGGKLIANELELKDNEIGLKVLTEGTIEIGQLKVIGAGTGIQVEEGILNINNSKIKGETGAIIEASGAKINIVNSDIETDKEIVKVSSKALEIEIINSKIKGQIIDKSDKVSLKINNNSKWEMVGASDIKAIEMVTGAIEIGSNKLTVKEISSKEGKGIIEMEVDVSEKENDRLEVEENIEGKYEIKVNNTKQVRKEEVKEQIRVIKTEAVNGLDTFSLANGKVNVGSYVYKLYQGSQITGTGEEVSKTSWYLVNSKEMAEYIKGIVRASELNILVAKTGMNSINKRLGDIRRTADDSYSGVWARGFGKNYELKEGINSSMNIFGVEAGYDIRVNKNSQDRYYIGLMIGYQSVGSVKMEQEGEKEDGNGEGSAPAVGVYGSWIGEKGYYVDVAMRYIMVDMKYTGYDNGQVVEYKPKGNYIGISGEFGKEYDISVGNGNIVTIEPQIELSMLSVGGSEVEASNNRSIEYSGTNSINGKIGVLAGYEIEIEGDRVLTPYIELSYNNEFAGKTDIEYMGEKLQGDISGGYFNISGGLNGYIGKGFSVYSLIGYESGTKQKNIGWNVGVRYGFGGGKELVRAEVNKGKKEDIDEIEQQIETVKDTKKIGRVVVLREQAIEKDVEGKIRKVEIEESSKYVKQSEISQGQVKYIKELAEGLSADRIEKVIVASHVGDNTGNEEENRKASIEKGKKVKYLLIKAGVAEDKIEIRGYGSKKQVADNSSKEGRSKNNRIEIIIKR